jgi:hypothetical protein
MQKRPKSLQWTRGSSIFPIQILRMKRTRLKQEEEVLAEDLVTARYPRSILPSPTPKEEHELQFEKRPHLASKRKQKNQRRSRNLKRK